MLMLSGKCSDPHEGREILLETIKSGKAINKFRELVHRQHGNASVIEDLSLLPSTANRVNVKTASAGYVRRIKAETIGVAAMTLGAGRENKDSVIDPAVGITVNKKIGDKVKIGEALAVIHAREDASSELVDAVEEMILSAYELHSEPVKRPDLIYGTVE